MPLVLAEEVADLAAADADVTGGYVGVLADVAVELGHEALAEPHDLGVGAALRVEVRPALAAADRSPVRAFLKICSKPRNLTMPEVDDGVEPQTALVGAERAVELHPETAVDVHLTAVVLPGHPEDDLPLRLAEALDDPGLCVVLTGGEHGRQALQYFIDPGRGMSVYADPVLTWLTRSTLPPGRGSRRDRPAVWQHCRPGDHLHAQPRPVHAPG